MVKMVGSCQFRHIQISLIFLASVFKLLFKLCFFGMCSFLYRFKVEMVM